ncbi:MAG: amidohydrolase, partial [Acidobacteriota bacterium]
RVGSIEVGKDADLALYDKHPLSVYSVVEMTLVDGKVYFDRRQDLARRAEIEKERKELLEKEKKKKGEDKPEKKESTPDYAAGLNVKEVSR